MMHLIFDAGAPTVNVLAGLFMAQAAIVHNPLSYFEARQAAQVHYDEALGDLPEGKCSRYSNIEVGRGVVRLEGAFAAVIGIEWCRKDNILEIIEAAGPKTGIIVHNPEQGYVLDVTLGK